MTTTGVPSFGRLDGFTPIWIGMDQMGGAFCEDSLTVSFADLPLMRDTLGIRNTLLAERDTLQIQQTDFSRYDLLVLNLEDTVFCPQDPVIFTLDATLEGATGYMWSTMETTPMITVMEPGEYSATVTIGEQICYILCDTTNIEQQMFPEIGLELQNNHCENRELTYTAVLANQPMGDTTNIMASITSYVWTDVNGDTISTNPSLTVPSEPGATYQVQIIDNCDNPANTIFTVPNLFPPDNASIGFDATRLCEDGILSLVANWDDGVQELFAFMWGDGQTTRSIDIDVLQAGDFVVTVTDACGHTSVATRTIAADQFETPNPTVIITDSPVNCDQGEPTITLTAEIEDVPPLFENAVEIEWNTGVMNSESIIVNEPGTFSVTVTVCDSVRIASIDVLDMLDVIPPTVDITSSDFSADICAITLTADATVSAEGVDVTYLWSTNQNGPAISVETPGTFNVTVTDMCGSTAEQSIVLTEDDFNVGFPTITINPDNLDPVFCGLVLNAVTTVGPGASIQSIVWTPFALGGAITVTEPGLYSVTVSDNCARTAEAAITISDDDLDFADPSFTIDVDEVLNENCERVLSIQDLEFGNAGLTLQSTVWSTGETTQSIAVAETSSISVTITDNCGNSTEQSIEVAVDTEIEFPNIFFPDTRVAEEGFQDNNTFGPNVNCPQFLNDYELQVFNRWGKRVFETSSVEDRWSGSLNNQGERLEETVYFWQSTYNGLTEHGSVTLVRNN